MPNILISGRFAASRRSAANLAASKPWSAPEVRCRVDPGEWRWIMSSAGRRSAWPYRRVRSPCTLRPGRVCVRAWPMKRSMAPAQADFLQGAHRGRSRKQPVRGGLWRGRLERARCPGRQQAVAVLGEHRRDPDRRVDTQAHEPAERQVVFQLLHQPPPGPDQEQDPDQFRPDQTRRRDRGATEVGAARLEPGIAARQRLADYLPGLAQRMPGEMRAFGSTQLNTEPLVSSVPRIPTPAKPCAGWPKPLKPGQTPASSPA